MSLNIDEILRIQDLSALFCRQRDALHDIEAIIPDDQRQINEVHNKIHGLLGDNNSVSLTRVTSLFALLTVVLEDYKEHESVKTYIEMSHQIVSCAIDLHGSEN